MVTLGSPSIMVKMAVTTYNVIVHTSKYHLYSSDVITITFTFTLRVITRNFSQNVNNKSVILIVNN